MTRSEALLSAEEDRILCLYCEFSLGGSQLLMCRWYCGTSSDTASTHDCPSNWILSAEYAVSLISPDLVRSRVITFRIGPPCWSCAIMRTRSDGSSQILSSWTVRPSTSARDYPYRRSNAAFTSTNRPSLTVPHFAMGTHDAESFIKLSGLSCFVELGKHTTAVFGVDQVFIRSWVIYQ